jgi:hypothetical protein
MDLFSRFFSGDVMAKTMCVLSTAGNKHQNQSLIFRGVRNHNFNLMVKRNGQLEAEKINRMNRVI